MNTCTNKGCRQSFKWPTQLARHMKNCNFPPVEVQKDYFKNSDDLFECRKCSKTFKYQSNVSRHKNDCKGQNVSVNKCTQCDKEFKYQSRLNKHLQVHEKNISQVCSNCCISFRRTDHFQKHIEHCGKGNKTCDIDNDNIKESENYDYADIDNSLPTFLPTSQLHTPNNNINNQDISIITPINKENIDFNVECSFSNAIDEINDTTPPTINETENSFDLTDTRNRSSLYYKNYRETNEKIDNLERVIQSISSPIKTNIAKKIQSNSRLSEILAYTDVTFNEARVCDSLIDYLKKLYSDKKYPDFYRTLHNIFDQQLQDEQFLKWLALKLNVRYDKFVVSFNEWKNRNFRYERKSNSLENDQIIYVGQQ